MSEPTSSPRPSAPPPRASPVPVPLSHDPDDVQADTPSGVYRVVQRTAWHTKVQWGVVGAFLMAVGAFVNYSIGKLDLVNTAMAQSQAKTDTTAQKVVVLEQRIEAVDAGTRAAIERLERKIDSNDERRQREREEDRALLQAVLKEVRKR